MIFWIAIVTFFVSVAVLLAVSEIQYQREIARAHERFEWLRKDD